MHRNAVGMDVGADAHGVAVPPDRDEEPVRRFGALTADRYALAAWLRQCHMETVVLESTGVSWIALFEVLAERGCDVKLVDAHDARQVPGRKTDVKDCQWLQELHTSGWLRGAFRPEDQICVLRSSLRQRRMLVAMASRAVQHRQKALEQMHLTLTEVVSAMNGKTGMEIIHAMLAGERDPQRLASHRDRRCKHDQATIAKALEGHWRAEHLFALQQALEQYEFLGSVSKVEMETPMPLIYNELLSAISTFETPPPLGMPYLSSCVQTISSLWLTNLFLNIYSSL
jgi:transposase